MDDLLEFKIPSYYVSPIINADSSGLSDEDDEELNEFINDVVETYGNANFMVGEKSDESYFDTDNDVNNLGGDVTILYLQPTKEYSFGGGVAVGGIVGAYLGYKIGRGRPQKKGFETEKKIGRRIKKEGKKIAGDMTISKKKPQTMEEGGKISVGAEGTLKNRGKVDVRAFDIIKGIDKVERGEYTFTVFDEGRIDKMNQNDFEKNFTQTKKGFYAEGGNIKPKYKVGDVVIVDYGNNTKGEITIKDSFNPNWSDGFVYTSYENGDSMIFTEDMISERDGFKEVYGRFKDDIRKSFGGYKMAIGGDVKTNREFRDIFNEVVVENEALPNDSTNVLESINAKLEDRGYQEFADDTEQLRNALKDRYDDIILNKVRNTSYAKGGSVENFMKKPKNDYEESVEKLGKEDPKSKYLQGYNEAIFLEYLGFGNHPSIKQTNKIVNRVKKGRSNLQKEFQSPTDDEVLEKLPYWEGFRDGLIIMEEKFGDELRDSHKGYFETEFGVDEYAEGGGIKEKMRLQDKEAKESAKSFKVGDYVELNPEYHKLGYIRKGKVVKIYEDDGDLLVESDNKKSANVNFPANYFSKITYAEGGKLKKTPIAIQRRVDEINRLLPLVNESDELAGGYFGSTMYSYVILKKPIEIKNQFVYIYSDPFHYPFERRYNMNNKDEFSVNGLPALKYDLAIILKAFKKVLKDEDIVLLPKQNPNNPNRKFAEGGDIDKAYLNASKKDELFIRVVKNDNVKEYPIETKTIKGIENQVNKFYEDEDVQDVSMVRYFNKSREGGIDDVTQFNQGGNISYDLSDVI